uniref:Uncharacterized protein n=1 Tax=Meloidogyne enterolobii TaxID=390850 RepID=A0A6V7U0S7_MELEN|nr:unnamed protein product [Meloidogyne enterolobii]
MLFVSTRSLIWKYVGEKYLSMLKLQLNNLFRASFFPFKSPQNMSLLGTF